MKISCVADREVDILIVGGGLIGAALMLALADSSYRCLLVEAQDFSRQLSGDFDARTLALSPATIKILSALQVWPLLKEHATAISKIDVSEQYRFARTRLIQTEDEPLGMVVEMQYVNQALHQLLNPANVLAPARFIEWDKDSNRAIIEQQNSRITVSCRLVVAADGVNSSVRKVTDLPVKIIQYQQTAFISNVGLRRDHHNHAFERFTQFGPLALLPMRGSRMALIWAVAEKKAQEFMEMSEQQFLYFLQLHFGYKLGRFCKLGKRALYPLQQALMPKQAVWPFVFVGNAAHTLHPVAGQGFNLGLRDVAALAQCILQQGLQEDMLQEYAKMRQYDQWIISQFTHNLIKLFSNHWPGVAKARQIGMLAMDNFEFLKKTFSFHARGFAGTIPDLVCGIPLRAEDV